MVEAFIIDQYENGCMYGNVLLLFDNLNPCSYY